MGVEGAGGGAEGAGDGVEGSGAGAECSGDDVEDEKSRLLSLLRSPLHPGRRSSIKRQKPGP